MVNKQKLITRRAFILVSLAVMAGIAALLKASRLKFGKWSIFKPNRVEKPEQAVKYSTLGELAVAKGILYGAFPQAKYQDFIQDVQYQQQIIRECNLLVSRFYWNWNGVRPTEDTYNFAEADYYAKFTAENKLLWRGHPLIWYRSTPDWLMEKFNNSDTTSQDIKNILVNHITTVVGRYAGQIHSWDVVNEAINVKDGRVDGLRDTNISGINGTQSPSWLDFLGLDYIDLAFQTAYQADPEAILTYNEYGLDYDLPQDEAKRNAVLKLLENLKAKGTPINAFGMQAHLDVTKNDNFSPQKLRQFFQNVADLDLKIIISELDVRDRFLQGDIAKRDRQVARAYNDFLTVALEEPAVIAVATWGLSDRYSWLQEKPRPDGTPQRPLPLDAQLNRKPAWYAIADAFQNAPKHQVSN